MNLGAEASSGDIILFLHGDSFLPTNWGLHVRYAASFRENLVGAFRFSLETEKVRTPWMLQIIQYFTNLRSTWLQFPYGDQGLFVRKADFDLLGKYQVLPFMEDVEFVALARRIGRIRTMEVPIRTSPRRWSMYGSWQNTFINQLIILGWKLGIPHTQLVVWYYGLQKKKTY
jgi:hypothetical protein